jgi:pentatricopeptide repeat protein
MVEALVANDSPEAGWKLIHELLADPQTLPLVNTVIYCSVLKGFSHQKRFDQVWAVYQEMLKERMEISISTYNALVDACARSGEMSRVQSLLEEMTRQKLEPNIITYGAIVKGYCQAYQLDQASAVFEDMKRNPQFKPDEITYNTLIDGCARQGLFEKGMQYLREMQEVGVRPSNYTLTIAAKLATRSKRPEKAFDLCDELARKFNIQLNIHVYGNLVQACAALKDPLRTIAVFEQMLRGSVRPDARTYTMAIQCCLYAGCPEDAAGLLRAACGLRGAHPRLASFGPAKMRLAAGAGGALAPDMVASSIEEIAKQSGDKRMALQLFEDVRQRGNIRFDAKMALRLTSLGERR